MINWFADRFLPGDRREKEFFKDLEAEAENIPIGCEGLITLPYWSGVMNPHWNSRARGCFIGLAGWHSPVHLYRSILEGVCLYQAEATRLLEKEAQTNIKKVVAIGGGASSPLWVQMMADAMGKQITVSNTIEASSLGAAMIAGYGVGWFGSIEAAAESMKGDSETVSPDAQVKKIWDRLLEIYGRIYADNERTFNDLEALASMTLTSEKRIP